MKDAEGIYIGLITCWGLTAALPAPTPYIPAGGGGGRKGCVAIARACPEGAEASGGGREGPAGTCAGALAIVAERTAACGGGAGETGSGPGSCASSPISAAKSANSSSMSLARERPRSRARRRLTGAIIASRGAQMRKKATGGEGADVRLQVQVPRRNNFIL